MADTKQRLRTAFGLSCDVIRAFTNSGYAPAPVDLSGGLELFGGQRVLGFARMLEQNFVEQLILIGGDEGRYPEQGVNRADTLRRILIRDFGIQPDRVTAIPSRSNTVGNALMIREVMDERSLTDDECCVVTSAYHYARTDRILRLQGVRLWLYTAEEFLLRAQPELKQQVIDEYQNGLAERLAEEVQGIYQLEDRTYQPKVDVAPSTVQS